MFENSFVKETILEGNGRLIPIIVPYDKYKYTCETLTNPAIYNDNGRILVNLRGLNQMLQISDEFSSWCGTYFNEPKNKFDYWDNNREDNSSNFIVEFNSDITAIKSVKQVNMFTTESKWLYKGLEDARLCRYKDKLYLIGVRRDTYEDGTGRIELSEVQENENSYDEIIRYTLNSPDDSYLEKHWVPIINENTNNELRLVRWSNPLDIIDINIEDNTLYQSQENLDKQSYELGWEMRNGSHFIKYKDYYIVFGHTSFSQQSYLKNYDFKYYIYIALYDKDLNLVCVSNCFNFFEDGIVQFCSGLCLKEDKLIVSFSDNDAQAFLLEFDADWLLNKLLDN